MARGTLLPIALRDPRLRFSLEGLAVFKIQRIPAAEQAMTHLNSMPLRRSTSPDDTNHPSAGVVLPSRHPTPTGRSPHSRLASTWVIGMLGVCWLSLFSGCLGRDYDQALRRITIPEKKGQKSDREVIDVGNRLPTAAEYGLRWTNGNQTYPGRGTNMRGVTSFPGRMTGANRWTNGRSTSGGTPSWNRSTSGGRTTGQPGMGRRVTNGRITTSRPGSSPGTALPGRWSNSPGDATPRVQYRDRQ